MRKDPMVVSLRNEPAHPPAPPPPPLPTRPRRRGRSRNAIIVAVCFCAVLGIAYWFFTREHRVPENTPAVTEQTPKEESLTIVERVGKHIVLPKGEEPTIATVSDPSKLQEQTFFADAKVGDVVLIYGKARKAYLYDPTIDKLLEVAPIAQ